MNSRQLLLSKADTLTETEVAEVLEYIGIMETLRDQLGPQAVWDDIPLVAWARSVVPGDRRQMRMPGVKGIGSLRI